MPSSISEFEDDTGFERVVLDRATPLLPKSKDSSVIDLRTSGATSINVTPATVSVSVGDSTRSPDGGVSANYLRPLFFGAAWKLVDLLVELSLEMKRRPSDPRRRYEIKEKADKAANDLVDALAPFDSHASLWSRLLHVYSSTTELRHSLVHRKLEVNPDTGEVTGEPKPGASAPPRLTVAELTAVCVH